MAAKLKPKVKAAWLADLRANPDLQGREYLERDGKFCCWGRLCLLAVEAGATERYESPAGTVSFGVIDRRTATPPLDVLEWAFGPDGPLPRLLRPEQPPDGSMPSRFVEALNDSGVGFLRIAELIERDW